MGQLLFLLYQWKRFDIYLTRNINVFLFRTIL